MKTRPRFLDIRPEVRERLIEATAIGATRQAAADYAGVSVRAFHKWIERGSVDGADKQLLDFAAAIREADGRSVVRNLATITKAAARQWQAAAWILERRHGYVRREEVKHDGKVETGPAIDYTKLTDAELHTLIALTAKAKRDEDPGGEADGEG